MATFIQLGGPEREEPPLGLPGDLGQRHPRATAADEVREALGVLNLAQHRAARLFGVGPRSIRRWRSGDRRIPHGIGVLLNLMVMGTVTVDQVEAAIPAPVRTNGDARLGLDALVGPAPAPEQSAPVADLAPTTAERVFALGAGMCRWPFGSPGATNFRFCSDPIAAGSYCKRHCAEAYMVRSTRHGRPASFRLSARY
jgi:hypothetical protein